MKYFTKYFLIIIFLGTLSSSASITACPTIIDITIEPSEPAPLSTITFTVAINNTTNIEDVRLILQECQGDMCFVDKWNESMFMSNGSYQKTITLLHEQTTQCKYNIAIKANETWFNTETTFFNLSIDEQNNPPENNPGDNATPGFELVVLFISAGLVLMRRQRKLKEKNN
jgi:hypothetical protein